MRPITAGDLMNPEVLTVRADMTVGELARFLLDHEITGAPVQDAEGKLVGVVSVVDIAAATSDEEESEEERAGSDFFAHAWEGALPAEGIEELDVDDEDLPEDLLVEEIMTPDVYSVTEEATVSEVASMMLREHLHRLLVTRDGKPAGIITTSDLLGLLIDEE